MSELAPDPPIPSPEPKIRPVGGTEQSWCKAVPSGTGITVLSLLLSKPINIPLLQSLLQYLQNSHPILSSKLHFSLSSNSFSFLTPSSSSPQCKLHLFDLQSTALILQSLSAGPTAVTPFHLILEHELNQNSNWRNPDHPLYADTDVLFASVYTLGESLWAVVLRLHTGASDRTAAVALLRELLGGFVGGGDGERVGMELGDKGEVNLGIEDLIPNGKRDKPFWARGMDLLGYSLNSLRLGHLDFVDEDSPRFSQVVRLKLDDDETMKLLDGCKSRGIKLCGALAAAGLIAARSSKNLPENQWEKYAVVTLVDCRSILDPPLSSHHLGFYHSAILNTHDISAEETLWDLAKRSYTAFANAKNSNKHFTDMADLNFLMCKAIENPGLTPSSSLRTSFLSVFEDPVIDDSNSVLHQEIGLEDYVGCASVHGVGPSIAMFDTIRDGRLDCACVYPSPLHTRDQIRCLIDDMKRILVNACNYVEPAES